MSGTEGLRQLVEERTRLLADNERLGARGRELEIVIDGLAELNQALRDRIATLEAEVAVLRGTLARYDATDEGPVTLIEGTPNAPR